MKLPGEPAFVSVSVSPLLYHGRHHVGSEAQGSCGDARESYAYYRAGFCHRAEFCQREGGDSHNQGRLAASFWDPGLRFGTAWYSGIHFLLPRLELKQLAFYCGEALLAGVPTCARLCGRCVVPVLRGLQKPSSPPKTTLKEAVAGQALFKYRNSK